MNHSINYNLFFPSRKFLKKYLFVKDIKIDYYQSQILSQNNFIHAFFTKKSSLIDLNYLGNILTNKSYSNYSLQQVHSSIVKFSSSLNIKKNYKADGLISDCKKENLWIYTADCMPILFADKISKRVAAIHCGRKGLEKNIISNLINELELIGSLRQNLLVAIGPSISGAKYLLDKRTYKKFHDNFKFNNIKLSNNLIRENLKKLKKFNENELISLDIKQYAYLQLINEDIDPNNIDISNKCTFNSYDEFHSWRRIKNQERQWSYISSNN